MQYANKRTAMLNAFINRLRVIAAKHGMTFEQLVTMHKTDVSKLSSTFTGTVSTYEVQTYCRAVTVLDDAKVVVMSDEQAMVFWELQSNYADGLDYLLPFPEMLIEFTKPLILNVGGAIRLSDELPYHLHGLLLRQTQVTRWHYETIVKENGGKDGLLKPAFDSSNELFLNSVFSIGMSPDAKRYGIGESVWQSGSATQWLEGFGEIPEETMFRNLAIACIGYINCENIYLHQEGGAPDKVNRKRAQQGKKILEPYYVCRIRGVQYDSNGEPTGEGTHHGFRYDVRGHFRRLDSGKTTWVRPHQRGLQHELYIPKTYVVEKGAKQMEPAP